jgi:hypothetical protein
MSRYVLQLHSDDSVDLDQEDEIGPFITTMTWKDGSAQGVAWFGGTEEQIWTRYEEVQSILSSGIAGIETGEPRAVLAVDWGTELPIFLDILSGQFDETPSEIYPQQGMLFPFTFSTLPFGRGAALPPTTSVVRTNGIDSVLFIPRIPGTAPALLRVELIDVSTGGLAINRARIGVFGNRALQQESDWSPFVDVVPRAPGTDNSGVATLSSEDITTNHQNIGDVASTERGQWGLLLRAKDTSPSQTAKIKITNITTLSTGGALPGRASYTYVVVAMIGSSVAAISDPFVRSIQDTGSTYQNTVEHSLVVSATDYRLYWRREPNAFLYLAQSNTLGSYVHATEVGGIVADPPASVSSSLRAGLLRAALRMAVGSPIATTQSIPFRLSNSIWEHLWLFQCRQLPPIGRGESSFGESSIATVQGCSGGSGQPNLSVDRATWFPRLAGQYAEVWDPDDDRSTLSTIVVDPDRSGTQRAYLSTGEPWLCSTDAVTAPSGAGVLVYAVCDAAGSVSDVTNLKFQLRVTVIPRYKSLGGRPA